MNQRKRHDGFSTLRRTAALAVVVSVTASLGATPAFAGTASVEPTGTSARLSYEGGPASNNVTITEVTTGFEVRDTTGVTLGTGCSRISSEPSNTNAAKCSATFPRSVSKIYANLAAGNDAIVVNSNEDAELLGGSGANTLHGGDGDDVIAGHVYCEAPEGVRECFFALMETGLKNHMAGRDGDDHLMSAVCVPDLMFGGNGSDTLRGRANLDGFYGGPGMVGDATGGPLAMRGGPGSDSLLGDSCAYESLADYSERSSGVSVNMATGGTKPDGDTFDERVSGVIGTSQTDSLVGNSGPNHLYGGAGADNLLGEGGDDVLTPGTGPGDAVVGGPGADTVSYAERTQPVLVTFDGLQNDGEAGEGDNVQQVENARGGAGNDTLTGDGAANLLDGGGGADLLRGGAGNDTLEGGGGNDSLEGGANNDTLEGRDGSDVLEGGTDNDTLRGGADNDTLRGQGGADTLSGGPGPGDRADYSDRSVALAVSLDNVANDGEGGEGDDVFGDVEQVVGGSGPDRLSGNQFANYLAGGGGADELRGGGGSDTLDGGAGNDLLEGLDGNDSLDGGGGNDRMHGGLGTNTLNGGDDIDTVDFSLDWGLPPPTNLDPPPDVSVNVNLTTQTASSVAGLGSAALSSVENAAGGWGNDLLIGNGGNNVLTGGDGDDRLDGRLGSDQLTGGPGADTAEYGYSGVAMRVNLGTGQADIDCASFCAVDQDSLSLVENVVGSAHGDSLTGSAAVNRLDGAAGNDTIDSRDTVADEVLCGGGADTARADSLDTVAADCESVLLVQPPTAAFSWSPAEPAVGQTVTFDGSGSSDPNGSVVRYEWDLDGNGSYETDAGGTPTASTTYSSAGERTVRLRVTDSEGLMATDAQTVVVQAPASDTTAPTTTIDSGPGRPTNDTTPAFEFSADEPADFECRIYPQGGPAPSFSACSGPGDTHTPATPLDDGDYSFEVRATDAASNVGDPASREFTVDTAAPETRITAGPGAVTNDTTPTFEFSADEPADFECRIYPQGGPAPSFSACSGPGDTHTPATPLDDGDYSFEVRATDAASNVGDPASREFTVDTAAPATTIDSGPAESSTTGANVEFGFSSTKPGVSFECRLDGASFAGCSSPKTYSGLADGSHTFQVRATDAFDNVGPTASRSFTVDTEGPGIEGPGTEGPGTEGPDTEDPDTEITGAALTAIKAQKQKRRVEIKAQASAAEPVDLLAKGKIKLKGERKAIKLKPQRKSATADESVQLVFQPAKKKDHRKVLKGLAAGKKAVAQLSVRFSDAAGNERVLTAKVKLR